MVVASFSQSALVIAFANLLRFLVMIAGVNVDQFQREHVVTLCALVSLSRSRSERGEEEIIDRHALLLHHAQEASLMCGQKQLTGLTSDGLKTHLNVSTTHCAIHFGLLNLVLDCLGKMVFEVPHLFDAFVLNAHEDDALAGIDTTTGGLNVGILNVTTEQLRDRTFDQRTVGGRASTMAADDVLFAFMDDVCVLSFGTACAENADG